MKLLMTVLLWRYSAWCNISSDINYELKGRYFMRRYKSILGVFVILIFLFVVLFQILVASDDASMFDVPSETRVDIPEETYKESYNISESDRDVYLENFSQDYPDFEILNYVVAAEENYPIRFVVIAENKENGTSSTLFIVDDNGVGQVVLASEYVASFRKEDGLFLKENIIALSLDVNISDENYEIHDFEITVSQKENQGQIDTLYSSKEVIRD
jgi:uncharacterized membrane protein